MLAKEKKLQFEVTDSVFLTDKKRGTITAQSPNPDFKVKENRKIFLTMNAFYPERVQVPDTEALVVSVRRHMVPPEEQYDISNQPPSP